MPFVGMQVTVEFLARRVRGRVDEFDERERRVVVVTENDEVLTFELSPATGNFVEAGRPVGGARLRFEG